MTGRDDGPSSALIFILCSLASWLTTTGQVCVPDMLYLTKGSVLYDYSPSMTGKKRYYFEHLLIILSLFLFV